MPCFALSRSKSGSPIGIGLDAIEQRQFQEAATILLSNDHSGQAGHVWLCRVDLYHLKRSAGFRENCRAQVSPPSEARAPRVSSAPVSSVRASGRWMLRVGRDDRCYRGGNQEQQYAAAECERVHDRRSIERPLTQRSAISAIVSPRTVPRRG